jgi:hypothetical protein
MIPRVVTPTSAFRVFRGYKRPDLTESGFLAELGAVFMPGTPLMLRDLGLAAYLPAIVPATGMGDVPDEVAIIAYASRDAYGRARNESVTGKLYTHTHLAVFDMARSHSQFPEPHGQAVPSDGVTAFHLSGRAADWQADGDVAVLVGVADRPDPTYADALGRELAGIRGGLLATPVLDVVGQVGAGWFSLWILLDGFGRSPDPAFDLVLAALTNSRPVVRQVAARLVWRDVPPAVSPSRPSAWSYVFERDLRHFIG